MILNGLQKRRRSPSHILDRVLARSAPNHHPTGLPGRSPFSSPWMPVGAAASALGHFACSRTVSWRVEDHGTLTLNVDHPAAGSAFQNAVLRLLGTMPFTLWLSTYNPHAPLYTPATSTLNVRRRSASRGPLRSPGYRIFRVRALHQIRT